MNTLVFGLCLTLLAIGNCQLPSQAANQEKVLLMKNISMTDKEQDAARYLADLDSPDQYVRSQAAVKLQRMGHPQGLEACLRTLNDGEDELHLDYTPAVFCLAEIGKPALASLLDRLLDNDEITRLRAQRAVEGITTRLLANGENESDVQVSWRKWWKEMGYSYDADPESRRAGLARLRAWMESLN
ncbi:HEAT repeat domain-containing protein [Cylindrospermum stagnale]|uniref:HEAT repeat domain-containing protein n=1 Tax=Cylindrospermum stagnale TaxID=142864 RepID=UPI00059CA78B|nr:HEAT repeat domain-containing protein [Cylindrospermum stagnale]